MNIYTIYRCFTHSCSSDHSCCTCPIIPDVVLNIFIGSPRIKRIGFTIPSTVAINEKEILNITAHIIAFPKPEMYWQFGQNGSQTSRSHYGSKVPVVTVTVFKFSAHDAFLK
jgi:hypothetical protein